MGTVAVIGEETAVRGYALAGAVVVPAEDEAAVRDAWAALDHDVDVVVLTARAAAALGPAREAALWPLTVVMPR
jgi:vacuolar-type H+-ATPase subunit F/Vma7